MTKFVQYWCDHCMCLHLPPVIGQEIREHLTMTIEAEKLAQRFHETYERLAPSFGYETRKESAKPWSEVPEKNKKLMIAVCAELLGLGRTQL